LICFGIQHVHLAMAVRTQGDGIRDRIIASLCQPVDMMTLKIRFLLLVMERGWGLAQITVSIGQPFHIFSHSWVAHED
jgi:hypothetical protein